MKRFVLSAFVLTAALWGDPLTYTIDPAHSSADFSVKHMMVSTVRGSFTKTSGTVIYDAGNLAGERGGVKPREFGGGTLTLQQGIPKRGCSQPMGADGTHTGNNNTPHAVLEKWRNSEGVL